MYINRFKEMTDEQLRDCYKSWLEWNAKGSLGCPPNCRLDEIREEYFLTFKSNVTFAVMQDLMSEISHRWYNSIV